MRAQTDSLNSRCINQCEFAQKKKQKQQKTHLSRNSRMKFDLNFEKFKRIKHMLL